MDDDSYYDEMPQPQDDVSDAVPVFNLYMLQLEKLMTDKYNKTVVHQIKNVQTSIANDLKSLPKINERLIDPNHFKLHETLPKGLKDINIGNNTYVSAKNAQLHSRKLKQSMEILKVEMSKGLPNQRNQYLIDQGINNCSNEYEYMATVIEKLKN